MKQPDARENDEGREVFKQTLCRRQRARGETVPNSLGKELKLPRRRYITSGLSASIAGGSWMAGGQATRKALNIQGNSYSAHKLNIDHCPEHFESAGEHHLIGRPCLKRMYMQFGQPISSGKHNKPGTDE
mmetsp:Transcript_18174/g.37880  ORF Transcript_18174/g.37880 Transcript_18174/m.37880 type:complete len:130 (+) Transcript_18174:2135-2524(+)